MGPNGQSIEDILASIKLVIAEETVESANNAAAPGDASAEDAADDVLELTRPIDPPADAPLSATTLVSPGTADASRQALAYLSALNLKGGEPGDDTLHGLVRELLKPMLKAWLDAELPTLVERLVVQEIARLGAGRS